MPGTSSNRPSRVSHVAEPQTTPLMEIALAKRLSYCRARAVSTAFVVPSSAAAGFTSTTNRFYGRWGNAALRDSAPTVSTRRRGISVMFFVLF